MIEKEILNYHPNELENNTEKEKNLRKQVIQRILKDRKLVHASQCMMKYIGKRYRRSLYRLHVKNEENRIIEKYISREEIEQVLIECNRAHFEKDHQMNIHKDKVYEELRNNELRKIKS